MCPVCRQPLILLELGGVEVDWCATCQGIWLDAGELELLGRAAGAAEPGELTRALSGAAEGPVGKRRCPRCRRRMRRVRVGQETGVEVDRCPAGDGLWFDEGELARTAASFSGGEEGAVARFFSEVLSNRLGSRKEAD